MYTYFVSFFRIDGLGRPKMGNEVLDLPTTITSRANVQQIESLIKQKYPNDMETVLTNWILLSEGESLSHETKNGRRITSHVN